LVCLILFSLVRILTDPKRKPFETGYIISLALVKQDKGEEKMVILDAKNGQMTFVCTVAPKAKKVFLVGDFNNWDPAARRMVKVKDGSFRAKMDLEPGRYEYKFVIDDLWITDPEATEHISNPYGTMNSVVEIGVSECCCGCECDCE